MLPNYNYQNHNDTAQILANRIINQLKAEGNLKFPIDPFYLLSRFNIEYKLQDFESLEGIYLVPNDEDDCAVVGINKNRPITRQRFTAAHEICHHIKDRNSEVILCPIDGRKNDIEKFADQFASDLLMPEEYILKKIRKYSVGNFVNFDNALRISVYFGTSFQSCVYALAYKYKVIEGDISAPSLSKRISSYKPDQMKKKLGLDDKSFLFKSQLIDNYSFVDYISNKRKWFTFMNHYISNEERLEGSNLDIELLNEIITDLRINKQESEYCSSKNQNVLEAAGQLAIFDYIFDSSSKPSSDLLKILHKKLYKYSPYPEYSGSYRVSNNYIKESRLETPDYRLIYDRIHSVEKDIQCLVNQLDILSNSNFLEKVASLHHQITVIHPFDDGNGRISRSILNWLLNLKGLYPIFVTLSKKESYLSALECADVNDNCEALTNFIIDEIIESDILLNNFYSI